MNADANTGQKGMRPWVRVLLVVSLGLNLLVIGAVAGVAITGGPFKHGGPPGAIANESIGPFMRALTKDDRRTIMRQVRQHARAEGWTRETRQQSTEEMLQLLEATPFDADAFSGVFETTVSGLQNRLSNAKNAFTAHISEMSDEDRAAYAARVKEMIEKKKR